MRPRRRLAATARQLRSARPRHLDYNPMRQSDPPESPWALSGWEMPASARDPPACHVPPAARRWEWAPAWEGRRLGWGPARESRRLAWVPAREARRLGCPARASTMEAALADPCQLIVPAAVLRRERPACPRAEAGISNPRPDRRSAALEYPWDPPNWEAQASAPQPQLRPSFRKRLRRLGAHQSPRHPPLWPSLACVLL